MIVGRLCSSDFASGEGLFAINLSFILTLNGITLNKKEMLVGRLCNLNLRRRAGLLALKVNILFA